eukprot:755133_1
MAHSFAKKFTGHKNGGVDDDAEMKIDEMDAKFPFPSVEDELILLNFYCKNLRSLDPMHLLDGWNETSKWHPLRQCYCGVSFYQIPSCCLTPKQSWSRLHSWPVKWKMQHVIFGTWR